MHGINKRNRKNNEKINKEMSSLQIAEALLQHSKTVLNKFEKHKTIDGTNIMWTSSPNRNKRKISKYKNSPSKKNNSMIPGLAAFKKPSTQMTLEIAKHKTRTANNITSINIKQELLEDNLMDIENKYTN